MANLKAIGLDVSAIDTVFITHMHPDHVGGLIGADDQPVCTEARGLVPSGEPDYWGSDIPEGTPELLTKQPKPRTASSPQSARACSAWRVPRSCRASHVCCYPVTRRTIPVTASSPARTGS